MSERIAYIFMNFPAPSEVFGRVEIESIRSLGITVDVYTLRNRYSGKENVAKAVSNYGTTVFFSKRQKIKSFLSHIVRMPRQAISYLFFITKVSSSLKEFASSLVLAPSVFSVAEKISSSQYEAAHCFWGHYPSLVIFMLKKKKFKGRISVFSGAYDLTSNLGIMRWGVNNADLVLTHCQYNVKDFRKFYDGPVNVIYRGIDCNGENNSKQPSLMEGVTNFIFSGRLIPGKRPFHAIDIFSRYIQEVGDAHLNMFGDGPLFDEVKEYISRLGLVNKVYMHSHVDQSIMFEYMRESHFILFPSKNVSERLPNVVKEAMNNGCVPVVDVTPGIHELVKHQDTGIVVSFDEPEDLIQEIENIIGTERLWDSMSMAAAQYVRERFDNRKLSKERVRQILAK